MKRLIRKGYSEEMPPYQKKIKGSRKFAGERVAFKGTRVDAVLAKKFDEEKERRRISSSDLMQTILWNRYGKPKLSFEE